MKILIEIGICVGVIGPPSLLLHLITIEVIYKDTLFNLLNVKRRECTLCWFNSIYGKYIQTIRGGKQKDNPILKYSRLSERRHWRKAKNEPDESSYEVGLQSTDLHSVHWEARVCMNTTSSNVQCQTQLTSWHGLELQCFIVQNLTESLDQRLWFSFLMMSVFRHVSEWDPRRSELCWYHVYRVLRPCIKGPVLLGY